MVFHFPASAPVEFCHLGRKQASSLWADPSSLACFGSGLVAAGSEHRGPGGHPDALLHHRPVLLRRVQTRHAASQPHPGELSQPGGGANRAAARPRFSNHPTSCLLGSAGLLRGSHLRTLSQTRTVYPHQLDGPRGQRVVLFIQCLIRPVACHGSRDGGGHSRGRPTLLT